MAHLTLLGNLALKYRLLHSSNLKYHVCTIQFVQDSKMLTLITEAYVPLVATICHEI